MVNLAGRAGCEDGMESLPDQQKVAGTKAAAAGEAQLGGREDAWITARTEA